MRNNNCLSIRSIFVEIWYIERSTMLDKSCVFHEGSPFPLFILYRFSPRLFTSLEVNKQQILIINDGSCDASGIFPSNCFFGDFYYYNYNNYDAKITLYYRGTRSCICVFVGYCNTPHMCTHLCIRYAPVYMQYWII